jgi:hypothetical protein
VRAPPGSTIVIQAERPDVLGDGFDEALDAPFGRWVERVAAERHLAAVGGDLDDAAAVQIEHIIATNLTGRIDLIRAVLPHLRTTGRLRVGGR